jgi:hypothetical protein
MLWLASLTAPRAAPRPAAAKAARALHTKAPTCFLELVLEGVKGAKVSVDGIQQLPLGLACNKHRAAQTPACGPTVSTCMPTRRLRNQSHVLTVLPEHLPYTPAQLPITAYCTSTWCRQGKCSTRTLARSASILPLIRTGCRAQQHDMPACLPCHAPARLATAVGLHA